MAEPGGPPAGLRVAMQATIGLTHGLGRARHRLADAAGMCTYALDGDRRRRTARNHRRAFPHLDERGARRLARASYREYARTIIDFLWACGIDDTTVLANSVVIGVDRIEAAKPTGAVLALSHHGNWDMAANIARVHGMPLTTVMAPIGDAWMTGLVVWARQRNRMEVFTPDSAARGLVRALRQGRFCALLSDIPGAGPRCVVDYCGGPVVFSTVPAWLAQRTGVPLLPVTCVRGEGGGEAPYVIRVHEPVAALGRSLQAVMADIATVLGAAVSQRPTQWYPFGDVYVDGPLAQPSPPAS